MKGATMVKILLIQLLFSLFIIVVKADRGAAITMSPEGCKTPKVLPFMRRRRYCFRFT